MKAISYLLISENRHIDSSMKNKGNRVIVQEVSYGWKDQVKTTVKDKLENSIKFFKKVLSKPFKPESKSLILILSIVPYFESQKCDTWTVNNVIMWQN